MTTALAGLLAAEFVSCASASVIWDEGGNGDLSNDFGAPTSVTVGLGTNSITGSTQLGDVDTFTFTVPDGAAFAEILLATFDSVDDLAFFALQAGPAITDPTSPAALLGWVHPSAASLGTNILDDMALGGGALGFDTPLGPGTYTLWMQQTGPELVSYGFDLVLVPFAVSEPSMAALFGLGLVALAVTRRRRARQR